MKYLTKTSSALLAAVLGLTLAADAFAAGNPKRGRVYFKMVCTVCHVTEAGKAIPPSTYTMAEWSAYMKADKHDKTGTVNPSVAYYTSTEYRKSVADSNRAAKKFLKMDDAQLFEDVTTFVVGGAKDSDTPASCE